MSTKSNNTTGNPYHDDDGKFTSANGEGGGKTEETQKPFRKKLQNTNNNNGGSFGLVPGANLSDLMTNLSQQPQQNQQLQNTQATGVVDYNTPLTMPTSIQDAEAQGNRILGTLDVVGYDSTTDLAVAFEFNKGLQDVVRDFPQLFSDEQLLNYGTRDSRQYGTDKMAYRQREQKIVSTILSRPIYQQRLQSLGFQQNQIMNILTKNMHQWKAKVAEVVEKGVGGWTGMGDLNQQSHELNIANVIKFNEHYSVSMQKWDKYPLGAIVSGHFFPIGQASGAYMVATHELGHHVFEKLIDLMDPTERTQLNNLLWAETNGVKDAHKLHKMGLISGYAETSRHEHIAEAFANHYCVGNQATKHNTNLFNFLKGVYNRIYGQQ